MSRPYRIKHVSELDPLIRENVLAFYKRHELLAVQEERYEDAARWRDAADMGLVVTLKSDPVAAHPDDFWQGFSTGMPYAPLDDLDI